jgi:hypothetical protein
MIFSTEEGLAGMRNQPSCQGVRMADDILYLESSAIMTAARITDDIFYLTRKSSALLDL